MIKNKNHPSWSLYPTLELMVTLTLLVPKVFRKRLSCDLNNHSTLGSTQAQTKPHRLISGVHPDLAGILPHCAANQHAGWGGEQERESSAVMGLLHNKNIAAQNESLFPKAGSVHLTLNNHSLSGRSHQNKHKKSKMMHLPVVLRLPLPMKGLAVYFPLWWKLNFWKLL